MTGKRGKNVMNTVIFGLSVSNFLFYGGLAIMAAAAAAMVICAVIFTVTGRKLKRKLEQEYGKPQR